MYRIRRHKQTLVIDTGADADQIIGSAIEYNGILKGVIVTAPDLDDSDTYTITLKDVDGNTIYSEASLAESSTTARFHDPDGLGETTAVYAPLSIPLSGNHTTTIAASGDQAADRTFTVVYLVQI